MKAGEVAARDTVDALCSGFGGAKDLEEVYMKLFGEEADHE